MRISWYGHACFLLITAKGTHILTDPFDSTIGYSLPKETIDIVTVSHHHFDHDAAGEVIGNPLVLDKAEEVAVKDVRIRGIASYHDKVMGTKKGPNVIFAIECEGIRLVHLGDLGHQLNQKQIEEIGQVDILMLPVGGVATISAEEGLELVSAVNPRMILPMHYRTPQLKLERVPFVPVINFTYHFTAVRQVAALEIGNDTLPSQQEVVVLQLAK